MSSDLQFFIRTTEEKALLESDIAIMEKSLFTNKETAWDEALKQIQTTTAEYIKHKLQEGSVKQAILDELKQYLQSLETLTLSTACEPNELLIESVSDWINKNIGANIIVEFKYDNSIMAGAEVIYKGKIIDLSYRQRVIDAISKYAL